MNQEPAAVDWYGIFIPEVVPLAQHLQKLAQKVGRAAPKWDDTFSPQVLKSVSTSKKLGTEDTFFPGAANPPDEKVRNILTASQESGLMI